MNPHYVACILTLCDTFHEDMTVMSIKLDHLHRTSKRLKASIPPYALDVAALNHRLMLVREDHRRAVSDCAWILWCFRRLRRRGFQDDWHVGRGYSILKVEFELWMVKWKLQRIGKRLGDV